MINFYIVFGLVFAVFGGFFLGLITHYLMTDSQDKQFFDSINSINKQLSLIKKKLSMSISNKMSSPRKITKLENHLKEILGQLKQIADKLPESKPVIHNQVQKSTFDTYERQSASKKHSNAAPQESSNISKHERDYIDTSKLSSKTEIYATDHNFNSVNSFGANDQEDSVSQQRYHNDENPYPKFEMLEIQKPSDELTGIYNQALDDRSFRSKFREKYQIFQFGNRNASAQAQGRTTEIEFHTSDTGDYLAVSSSASGFIVVPQFDITISETTLNEGGFGMVFDCRGFQSGKSFSIFEVVSPATFERRGDVWHFQKPGILNLIS